MWLITSDTIPETRQRALHWHQFEIAIEYNEQRSYSRKAEKHERYSQLLCILTRKALDELRKGDLILIDIGRKVGVLEEYIASLHRYHKH
jgi:hypothetical protein